jgi:arginyl-tRNA synthetase
MPPCLILKSDGAALYLTTDLATILDRVQNLAPDAMVYLTDKRQSLHFEQLFRCAKKTGIAPPEVSFRFLGFGTMNGADGKPFKTRDGGVMQLEDLVAAINEEMAKKIAANPEISSAEAEETARIVALAALKYGDLSNQAEKDYIFDIDRFTSFEGDTGPYILYTIVRIKSVLAKFAEGGAGFDKSAFQAPDSPEEKAWMLAAAGFNAAVAGAATEIAPHRLAAYVYELANAFNTFYHQTRILTEPDPQKKAGYLALLAFTKDIMETSIELLGFAAPERM